MLCDATVSFANASKKKTVIIIISDRTSTHWEMITNDSSKQTFSYGEMIAKVAY